MKFLKCQNSYLKLIWKFNNIKKRKQPKKVPAATRVAKKLSKKKLLIVVWEYLHKQRHKVLVMKLSIPEKRIKTEKLHNNTNDSIYNIHLCQKASDAFLLIYKQQGTTLNF